MNHGMTNENRRGKKLEGEARRRRRPAPPRPAPPAPPRTALPRGEVSKENKRGIKLGGRPGGGGALPRSAGRCQKKTRGEKSWAPLRPPSWRCPGRWPPQRAHPPAAAGAAANRDSDKSVRVCSRAECMRGGRGGQRQGRPPPLRGGGGYVQKRRGRRRRLNK